VTDAITLYNAGTAALRDGKLHPALDLLAQAIKATTAPSIQGPAWRNIGIALRKVGATEKAAQAFLQALEIDGSDVDARYSLGNTFAALGEYTQAIDEFQVVRTARPQWAQPANNEGAAWMALGRSKEAEDCFQAAIHIDPNFAHAWGNLGAARAAQGRHAAPLHTLQKALSLAPNNHQIRTQLGHLLTELGHLDAAVRTFQGILKAEPQHADARAGIGLALHRSGESIRGLSYLAPSIATGNPHPDEAVAFARICLHLENPEVTIEVLQTALKQAKHPATQVLIGKQLGLALDAAGKPDEAFAAIANANQLRNLSFDAAQHSTQIDALIQRSLRATTQSTCTDSTPVFIVGMPRSGTTLIEQMLDAHPEIHGAGERGELQMVAKLMRDKEFDENALNQLASAYLNRIRPLAPNAKKITDKMPDNFMYLGEAAQLFPEARVIHCIRDPADTGLSCLFQNFKDTLKWTTQQEDIAAFTRDYQRTMNHWAEHGNLRMLTVPYESLVHEPELWARRILRFLDLPFHSSVLHPDQNPRIVRTASHDQIRRPIHTKSVGRFWKYKAHIQTLINLREGLPQSEGNCDRKGDGRNHHE